MLYVYCGDDSVSSRSAVLIVKKSKEEEGFVCYEMNPKEVLSVITQNTTQFHLFSDKQCYVIQELESHLRTLSSDVQKQVVTQLNESKAHIVDWEEGTPKWELRVLRLSLIKEYKLPTQIFNVLQHCVPQKKIDFMRELQELSESKSTEFVFYMLVRHIRLLVCDKFGVLSSSIPSWQRARIHTQSSEWSLERLISFYQSLYRVEKGIKTGSLPYSLSHAVSLACVYNF